MSEKVDDRPLGNHVVSHRRYILGTGPCRTGHRPHMKHGSAREASEYFDVQPESVRSVYQRKPIDCQSLTSSNCMSSGVEAGYETFFTTISAIHPSGRKPPPNAALLCVEPQAANLFKRRVAFGVSWQVCKHLLCCCSSRHKMGSKESPGGGAHVCPLALVRTDSLEQVLPSSIPDLT